MPNDPSSATRRTGRNDCNRDAPALEYNVDAWLRALGSGDEARERETARLMRFQEGTLDGEAPGNLHSVQRSSSTAPLPPAVVPENCPFPYFSPFLGGKGRFTSHLIS